MCVSEVIVVEAEELLHEPRTVAEFDLRWVGAETDFSGMPSAEAGPERVTEDRDDLRRVSALVAELPEGLRTPLLLSAMEGMSLAGIGALMGLSAKAVEVRIYRARKALKVQFGDEGDASR